MPGQYTDEGYATLSVTPKDLEDLRTRSVICEPSATHMRRFAAEALLS